MKETMTTKQKNAKSYFWNLKNDGKHTEKPMKNAGKYIKNDAQHNKDTMMNDAKRKEIMFKKK